MIPRALVPLGLAASLLLLSCSDEGVCGQADVVPAASCAAGIQYADHFYTEWPQDFPAVRGDQLGEAIYPVCNGTNDCATYEADSGSTKVWALRGVDPDVAVVARTPGPAKFAVYARDGFKPSDHFWKSRDGRWHLRRP